MYTGGRGRLTISYMQMNPTLVQGQLYFGEGRAAPPIPTGEAALALTPPSAGARGQKVRKPATSGGAWGSPLNLAAPSQRVVTAPFRGSPPLGSTPLDERSAGCGCQDMVSARRVPWLKCPLQSWALAVTQVPLTSPSPRGAKASLETLVLSLPSFAVAPSALHDTQCCVSDCRVQWL